ncbi:alpha/beta hydrolase [Streptomyces sp. NPDC048341]|uniref:esterase/lipase family protein n=1 Tax=Streptomyces sp. NPDC048341 TaxID=3154620 RepID=UPI00344891D5
MSVADSMVERAKRAAGSFGLVTPVDARAAAPAPSADEEWELPGGRARVYYGAGPKGMVRPVVLADGLGLGPTDFDWLWNRMENGPFPFVSELRRRGRTLVLVGFAERGASVLQNAETMTAAVMRTVAEQLGGARLLVGGFGTGGLVARYALARMETQRLDHRTGVCLSFDSPHRGAWLPIGLQAFAHHLAPYDDTYLRQISSPAARQVLWRHLDGIGATPQESPLRTEFKRKLHDVGGWPCLPPRPRRLQRPRRRHRQRRPRRGEDPELRRPPLRRHPFPRPGAGPAGRGGRGARRPRRPPCDHHGRLPRTRRRTGRHP